MDKAGAGRGCRHPYTWIVLLSAIGIQLGRERLLDGGLLLEELEALPDPALVLLQRLNLTHQLQSVKQALEERREQAMSIRHQLKGKLRAKHPAVLIPGIISCGLEVWRPGECLGEDYFRERLWGGVKMAHAVLRNITCWLHHMSLDPRTGGDPPDVAVRAAEGFSGADYFIPGYWLWGKLIEGAAAIGYDPNTLHLACYDWRLPYSALERRDRYFTRLRANIELMVESTGEKAVVVAHSMGANVFLYFMQWVSRAAGPDWVAAHVHAFVPLGGAMLGAVGPVGALLSGEMQASAILGPLNRLIDSSMSLVNYTQVRDFLRTWGSMGSLLPVGGDAVWGSTDAPTDARVTFVCRAGHSHSVDWIMRLLQKEMGNHSVMTEYSFGIEVPPPWPERATDAGAGVAAAAEALRTASSNPLATALPPAPDMRIFCLYGTGVQTERAYHYANASEEEPNRFGMIDYRHHVEASHSGSGHEDAHVPGYSSGVASTDGDGTVPLVSLGYTCIGAWREESLRAFNPSRAPVHVREYVDQQLHIWEDPRGGPAAATHVEILGNREVMTDILHIFAGDDAYLREDRVNSRLPAIAKRVTANIKKKFDAAAAGGQ